MKSALAAGLLLAVTGIAAPLFAQGPGGDSWFRAAPLNKGYSIETPCSEAKVTAQSVRPMVLNGQTLDLGTNVSCIIDEMTFMSGILSVSASEVGDDNLFDVVVNGLSQRSIRPEVSLTQTNVAGRRAILSREAQGSEIAQTGVIELSNRELLMLMSGGKPTGGEDVVAMIDRHVASLKVAQK